MDLYARARVMNFYSFNNSGSDHNWVLASATKSRHLSLSCTASFQSSELVQVLLGPSRLLSSDTWGVHRLTQVCSLCCPILSFSLHDRAKGINGPLVYSTGIPIHREEADNRLPGRGAQSEGLQADLGRS